MNNFKYIDDLISVIIPVYNCEIYIRECLESILSQSYKEFELLLINDGSTDKSGEICDEYAKKDRRVNVWHIENGGPAAARNIGIEKSKGSFICFVDADDTLAQNALEFLIQAHKESKTELVIGNFNKIMEGNINYSYNQELPNDTLLNLEDIVNYTMKYLKKPNRFFLFCYIWGRLFESSIIKENNIRFITEILAYEDIAFNYDYLKCTSSVYYLSKEIYNYRIYDMCSSAGMKIHMMSPKFNQKALDSVSDFLNKNKIDIKQIRKKIGHAFMSYTIVSMIRSCRNNSNLKGTALYKFFSLIIKNKFVQESIKYYSPSKGESKILPILIRFKMKCLIIKVCKYKARKRYS